MKVNITDRGMIYKIFEDVKPDMVVNFAAENHVDRSIENPEVFLDTNIKGADILMDACCKYGVKRFHQISTDDLLAMSYHRTYGLPVTISRCSNNYGPYQFEESLIPRMIKLAMRDETLPVYGNGLNVRDWIYVTDHCRAIDLILHKGQVGHIYNVGANQEKRNIDVVKMICKDLDKPESLVSFVEDRRGHDLRYAVDVTKIQQELGWTAMVGFEEGLKKTVEWYKRKL